jgi:uroporphyrinogen-III decarboxylase
MIDRTDMAVAKRKVGHHCCLAGNIPTYLFLMDDPKVITSYCRELIETAAPGGGFMMASGTALDRANRAMVEAVIETVNLHGWY